MTSVEATIIVNTGVEQFRSVKIGSSLSLEQKNSLMALITECLDVFVWSYEDTAGINCEIVEHYIPSMPTTS